MKTLDILIYEYLHHFITLTHVYPDIKEALLEDNKRWYCKIGEWGELRWNYE